MKNYLFFIYEEGLKKKKEEQREKKRKIRATTGL